MNTTEAAEKWNTTRDVVARWCKDGKVPGAEKPKFRWVIPDDASRPIDKKLQREFVWQILQTKNDSVFRLDFTEWGIDRKLIARYFACMTPLLFEVDESENPENIRVTKHGFALIGRDGVGQATTCPNVIAVTAETAGTFLGSFSGAAIKQCYGI